MGALKRSQVAMKKTNGKIQQPRAVATKAPILAVRSKKTQDVGGVCDTLALHLLENAKWRTEFLPTLYHPLYVSENPFKDFRKGSDKFLSTLQSIFNLVFPNIIYKVSHRDAITTTAVKRVMTRRSLIASGIFKKAEELFSSSEFAGNPQKIVSHVHFVLKSNGSLYYAQPTPADCLAKKDEFKYIKPRGYLQSEFVIAPTIWVANEGRSLY